MYKSVAQEYALDENIGNTIREDSIVKEMKDMSPAFKKLDNGEIVLIGYQSVNCHMIFDVKNKYFHQKARLVAGGHVIDRLFTITYVSVVYRETVIIALTLDAHNDFPVKVADIKKPTLRRLSQKIYG